MEKPRPQIEIQPEDVSAYDSVPTGQVLEGDDIGQIEFGVGFGYDGLPTYIEKKIEDDIMDHE